MRRIPRSLWYEIEPSDVSQQIVRMFGRPWIVGHFMGRILPLDVGKRVRLRGGVVEVENEEQRTERLSQERQDEYV